MKKYIVFNSIMKNDEITGNTPLRTAETRDNYVGDYIEAGDPDEAVEYAIDYLCERICENINSQWNIEKGTDEISVFDENGKPIEIYYGFEIEEKEE